MEKFNSIYPFTTENIAGYMDGLDLTDKKIITVTGSSDHIINAIANGSTDITTFDINPLAKYYMDLKLASLEDLAYEDFIQIFLYDDKNIDIDFINNLNMSDESKLFWTEQLMTFKNDWVKLKKSSLFNRKYFNPDSKLWQNLYLEKNKYEEIKKLIDSVNIIFLNISLKDLVLNQEYDYMFLSNISDYINLMYNRNTLENYRDLLVSFLGNVSQIYLAYLYDIGNDNPRSDIDNLEKVKKVFKQFEIKSFRSALENQEDKEDGVLILRRDNNVRK